MSDIWRTYQDRITAHGGNIRNASLLREQRLLNTKLPNTLSYFTVDIFPQKHGYNINSEAALEHKIVQNVAIVNSDNLNEKTLFSLPSEDIELGSLVSWMNNYWLVVERDANTAVYTRCKLLQCNHLLRWVSADKEIMEQWCVIEDGTKYLTGEYEDKDFVVTRGDSRISMQIARNMYTVRFDRECRFLIDDEESPHKLAYLLTKPLKRGLTYNNDGTFKFVLQEVTATEYDNHELGVADYYRHFPRNSSKDDDVPTDTPADDIPSNRKKVWI